MENSTLYLVYACDNNYAQHTGVSMISLFDNNKHFNNITVFIIENEISEENIQNLKLIAKQYNRKIEFISFNKYKKNLNLEYEWNISISAYSRLFISTMLPNNIEKVLYYDCDSIIVDKLDEVWEEDIEEYYVAGVIDTVSARTKLSIGINEKEKYINSGMLLINLKKWRNDDIENKFMEFIYKYNGRVNHHDQGVINGVLNKSIKILPLKFNLMTVFYTMKRKNIIKYYNISDDIYSEIEIKNAINNPVYIHYTPGFVGRPWIKGCKHPKKDLYRYYLNKSPWKNYILQKDNSSIKIKIVNWIFNNIPFSISNYVVKKLQK